MELIVIFGLLFFVLLQGAAIFATAFGVAYFFGLKSAWWKPILMLASWFGWAALTITGYLATGGDGGLMDGFGMILTLCFTALISALVFTAGWCLIGSQEDSSSADSGR